jgi:hypothetical protein
VKPHGIQYHMFEENLPLGRATAERCDELDPSIILMTMAMTKYDAEARKVSGVRVPAEGFADRVYADDGQLVSRKLGKDALVSDPAKAADQAVEWSWRARSDHHRQGHRRRDPDHLHPRRQPGLGEDRGRGARRPGGRRAPSSSRSATGSSNRAACPPGRATRRRCRRSRRPSGTRRSSA